MKTKTRTPAGGPGVDFDALGSAESVTNSPPFHGERKGAAKDFVAEMYRYVPEDARIMSCQFRGDPNSDIYGKWRARVLNRANMVDELANVYLCVSAMRQNDRGEWRRRKENFAGGLLLMIDDVGDGKGSKFPLSTLSALQPTCLVETSPGNFQATYFFDQLLDDLEAFDALIRAFIEKKFLGSDTGQAGVNRVFRPPTGINGKEKYVVDGRPWRVRGHDWRPDLRYSPQQLADAFGLELSPERAQRRRNVHSTVADTRIAAFELVEQELYRLGMVRGNALPGEWLGIYCPWEDEHSNGDRTGAAIVQPGPKNHWNGGFCCHHGHCANKGWRDLTDWLADEHAEVLAQINRAAPEWLENDR